MRPRRWSLSPPRLRKTQPAIRSGLSFWREPAHWVAKTCPWRRRDAEQQRTLVVMEATGHYWQNLFAALVAEGYPVALVNPLRTHRFAGQELARTKTDRIDCLQIARFGAQKRPAPTCLPETAAEELRELVRLRTRLMQEMVDRVNQLHRLIDLGFSEFTRYRVCRKFCVRAIQ